jgi:photosynthetic reaction center cytochrome c subunit
MMRTLVSRRVMAAASGFVFAAVIFVGAQQPARQLEGKTAAQAYQNIQVLKDIPADKLIPSMQVIAGSLGVRCQFCHVQGQFAKDDKENKKTARKMMMMMMSINMANFNGRMEVTCFTCHRGSNNPVSTLTFEEAMAAAPQGGGEARGAAAQRPSVDQILASYVQALGGEQAIRKVTSRSITATREVPARGDEPPAQAQVEQYQKAPNMMVMITHAPKGATTASGFDGTTAWTENAKGVVKDLTGIEEARAARAADFYRALDLKQQYGRLVARRPAMIGDHEAYVVVGVPQGDQPERLFFDTKTGLLLRKITVVPTPVGNLPTQFDYDDYRDTGSGVKVPFLIHITTAPRNVVTIHVQKVQDNAPIDNSKFAKPESKAAQAR